MPAWSQLLAVPALLDGAIANCADDKRHRLPVSMPMRHVDAFAIPLTRR